MPEKELLKWPLDVLQNIEAFLDKKVCEFETEDFLLFFQEIRASSNTFGHAKTKAMGYITKKYGNNAPAVQVLQPIQYRDVGAALQYDKKYFKNFQLLNQQVESFIDVLSDGCTGLYDTTKAAIYLAWYGVPRNMATDILKRDVSRTENIVCLPTKEVVEVGDYAIDFFRSYCDEEYYERIGRGGAISKLQYKDSPYLIRTMRSAHLTPTQMQATLKRFSTATCVENRFSYTSIYQSGVFYRMYLEERKRKGLPEVVGQRKPSKDAIDLYEKLLCKSFPTTNQLYLKILEYREWKKCFYEGED